MKTRNTIIKGLTMTVAVAALVVAGWLQPVKAQSSDGSVSFVTYASVGVVRGERVRLSVGNPEKSTGNLTLSFSFYLAHGTNAENSVPLYESEWIQVPPGQFRFSDVSREDLKTEGEPRTGRAQMMVKATIIAPAGSNPEDFPTSLELLKDETQGGESAEIDTKYRLVILAAKRSKQINAPIGVLPGQTLRYTFLNPNEAGSQPVSVTTFTYDSYGNLQSRTAPVEIRPGQSHTFDINYDDLRVAGDKDTGLLQVSTGIQVALMDGSVRPVKLAVSMEVVENRTGSTSGGNYFTGTVSVSGDGF